MTRDGLRRVLFVGCGDIQRSLGARTYFLSLLEALRADNSVQATFLQQVVDSSPQQADATNGIVVTRPPLQGMAAFIPALLWRPYELAWAICRSYRLLRADKGRSDVCILVGAGLLPLVRLFGARFPRLLYIQHGIAEEFLLSGKSTDRLKYTLTKTFERAFLAECDAVIVVSAKMGDYCRREYGVTRTLIVPCGVHFQHFDFTEEDRARIRRALGLEDRFVFVYSGGASSWQCIHETIQFYLLSRTIVPNAFFLILSPDVDAWREALRSVDPAEYRIVSLPHSDVGRYLCGGDAAFLLRSQSLVNIVSSPVKFAEYLASGLPIITSAYVGDYSSTVHDDTLGVVIDPGDRSTWPPAIYALKAMAADPLTRTRCRSAAERLSWGRIAEHVRATLDDGDRSVRGHTAAAAG